MTLKIFQIHYKPEQIAQLDPAFIPYDNSGPAPELREFEVFRKLHAHSDTQGAMLWGALSWRFHEKTGLHGSDLLQIVHDNPAYDVYYVNPYPANTALYQNMWIHGIPSHPQFLELATAFFEAVGLDTAELTALQPSFAFSYTNSFVGTPVFWSAYITFINEALAAADANLPPVMRTLLHSPLADPKGYHADASYVPFIVERLFPYFMRTIGKELKLKAFPIRPPANESELDVHHHTLRSLKDLACASKSLSVATSWINYRNLYLNTTHTQEWLHQHLASLTPASAAEIEFLP